MDDCDVDLSWDETGEVTKKINSGEFDVFCVKAECFCDGSSIAEDFLGGCIYAHPEDFQDHKGMNARGHGSYFSDMIRTVCREARKHLNDYQPPKMRRVEA